MFEISYIVGAKDLEAIYLHVNHARALTLLETARLELLKKLGHPSESLIERDVFPVISRIDVTYKREILAGPVRVTCEEGRIDFKTMYLTQRIINERGKDLVFAKVESMFMQGATKRGVVVPEALTQSFREFFPSRASQ